MADVDSTRKDAVAGPRYPSVLHPDPHKAWIIIPRPLRLERLAADERAAPLDDPGAVHLERRLMPVEVLPGQEVALLQAQRVPRSQANRLDPQVRPGLQERSPDPQSLRRGWKELEPGLSRVSGSRDEERGSSTGNGGVPSRWDRGAPRARFPPPLDFRWNRAGMGTPRRRRNEIKYHASEGLDPAQVHGRETLEQLARPRTLAGQAESLQRAVRVHDIAGRVGLEPRPHRGSRAGVANEHEPVRRQACHDHIVEDRP